MHNCPECEDIVANLCYECGCCEDCCACPPQDDSAEDAYRDTLEGR